MFIIHDLFLITQHQYFQISTLIPTHCLTPIHNRHNLLPIRRLRPHAPGLHHPHTFTLLTHRHTRIHQRRTPGRRTQRPIHHAHRLKHSSPIRSQFIHPTHINSPQLHHHRRHFPMLAHRHHRQAHPIHTRNPQPLRPLRQRIHHRMNPLKTPPLISPIHIIRRRLKPRHPTDRIQKRTHNLLAIQNLMIQTPHNLNHFPSLPHQNFSFHNPTSRPSPKNLLPLYPRPTKPLFFSAHTHPAPVSETSAQTLSLPGFT